MMAALLPLSPGCSGDKSPVTPCENSRFVENFANDVPIFEPDDALLENSTGFHEIDLARLIGGWNWGYKGQVYNPYGWTTAAVSMQRGPNCTSPFKPVIRFLQGSESQGSPITGSMSDVHWVTGWDANANPPGSHQAEYRHPKCAALAYLIDNETYVEVAVVYQVHGLSESEILSLHEDFDEFHGKDEYDNPFNETNTAPGDWDIGITLLRWHIDDFPDDEEPERYDFLIPDTGFLSQYPDTSPDVAYDFETGDLYIVYSKAETPLGIEHSYIRYVWGERDDSPPYWFKSDIIFESTWGDAGHWPRMVQTDFDHNGHTPSVEIGLLDFFVHVEGPQPDHYWVEDKRWICIAYTSQFDGFHAGYHVIAGGWNLEFAGWQDRVFLDLRCPELENLNAGLPCIAVTPVASARNFAAVVLSQVAGSDGYGPILRVFEVDLFGIGTLVDIDSWFEVPSPDNHADCLFPAIALHKTLTSEGPFSTSITYMAQEPEMNLLHPAMISMEIELTIDDYNEPYLEVDRTVIGNAEVLSNVTITGNYNISQIPFIDPGVSTSLVATLDGEYWAAWSERIEMEPPPEVVEGTYGWIGY